MKNLNPAVKEQRPRTWEHQSPQERILEIQELIVSPYWQHLNPDHRRQWLNQLDELQRQH